MGIEIVAHVLVPLIGVIIFLLVIAIVDRRRISPGICNDIALDICILGIGTTGGIFVNPALIQRYGPNATIYGILVTMVDLLIGTGLGYIRWSRADTLAAAVQKGLTAPPVTKAQALLDLALGNLTLAISITVIAYGLRHPQPPLPH